MEPLRGEVNSFEIKNDLSTLGSPQAMLEAFKAKIGTVAPTQI